MNFFKKILYLIPALLIIIEISYLSLTDFYPKLNPSSEQNTSINQIVLLLQTAKLTPIQLTIRDYQHEIEFFLETTPGKSFPIIFSTTINPFQQVTALQKLIKIANIKGQDIKFIDFNSSRPYATL